MKRCDWFRANALISAALARVRSDAPPSATHKAPARDRSATPTALPAVPASTSRPR